MQLIGLHNQVVEGTRPDHLLLHGVVSLGRDAAHPELQAYEAVKQ